MSLKNFFITATILATLILILGTGCKKNNDADSHASVVSADFNSLSDTLKIKQLLEQKIPMDSLAIFVGKASIGKLAGVNINDFSEVDTYIYTQCGEKDYGVYASTLESYRKSLPLVDKLANFRNMSLEDADKLGYHLGLEYVNDVMEKKLTIGKIDSEIADFRRACGSDEDTYNRFLIGFATGINSRMPGEIPADIVERYGKAPSVHNVHHSSQTVQEE